MKTIVKVGDPSKRQAIRLPATMRELHGRVGELFGRGKDFQLWLDAGAQGRAPGRGKKRITNEAEYSKIRENDVIVLAIDGRILDASMVKHLSTMQADYRPMPYAKEARIQRGAKRSESGKWWGESSHRLDFQAPPPDYTRTGLSKFADEKRPFTTGTFAERSTYQDDFPQHPFCQAKAVTKRDTRQRSKKNFTHLSSYNLDFAGDWTNFTRAIPYRPDAGKRLSSSRGEPMLSCYQAEFPPHDILAYRKAQSHKLNKPFIHGKPFDGNSTYQRDFLEKSLPRPVTVFLEPQAMNSDRTSCGSRCS